MATSIDIVDLTTESSFEDFSDDEDRAAFGYNPALHRLFRYKIWNLKHNDPNVAILNLQGNNMPHTVCERIGIYLWSSKYIKNLQLDSCSLSYSKVSTNCLLYTNWHSYYIYAITNINYVIWYRFD